MDFIDELIEYNYGSSQSLTGEQLLVLEKIEDKTSSNGKSFTSVVLAFNSSPRKIFENFFTSSDSAIISSTKKIQGLLTGIYQVQKNDNLLALLNKKDFSNNKEKYDFYLNLLKNNLNSSIFAVIKKGEPYTKEDQFSGETKTFDTYEIDYKTTAEVIKEKQTQKTQPVEDEIPF